MAAQTFTVLNNGGVSVNITGINFNTPAGIQHVANITNFTSGTASFTGSSYVGTTALAAGQGITFTVDHYYLSGPVNTRVGTIEVLTDIPSTITINTTIVVGNSGATVAGSLPGQGTYTANRTNISNGEAYILMSLTSNGTLTIDAYNGSGLYGAWITPWPTTGIGTNYWVKFTRQSYTGSGTYYSSPTTGWLQLNQTRSVISSATGQSNGVSSTQTTQYLVEVASDSSGSTIVTSGTYTFIPTGSLGGIVNPLSTAVITASGDTEASGSITFTRAGGRVKTENSTGATLEPWYVNGGASIGDSYYIRATVTSGTPVVTSPLNTWLQLNSNRSWSLVANSGVQSNVKFDISTAPSTSGIVASGTAEFNLSVAATGGTDTGGGGGGLTTTTTGFDDGSTISVTTDDNGQTVSVTSTPATDGNGGPGGKVICTELYHQGFLEQDIYEVDQQYGKWLLKNNPSAYKGYRIWADVLVDYMQGRGNPILPKLCFWLNKDQQQKLSQKIAVNIARALGKPFAYELARREGKYNKFNLGGYLLVTVGLKICSLIFKLKGKK